MKKVTLWIFSILAAFIIQADTCNQGETHPSKINPPKTSSPKLPTTLVSLNGIPVAQASDMVAAFVDDNTSSDLKTDIWLSKAWVGKMDTLLTSEKNANNITDGIRIYFAKKKLKNTIVIVSTKDGGSDANSDSHSDHMDYFDHTSPFFPNVDISTHEDYGRNKGAVLFNASFVCPVSSCSTTNDGNYISCDDAHAAVQNVKKKMINIYSEWFPLSVIVKLDSELNAAVKHVPSVPADGIRIYFAKYLTTAKKHKNRYAFIITTTKNVKNIHTDYFECYYTPSPPLKTTAKAKYLSGDNGEQCPNNCNGVTLPN